MHFIKSIAGYLALFYMQPVGYSRI